MCQKISTMKKYIFLFLFLSIKLLAQNYSVQSFNTSNSAIPFQNLSQVQADNANNIWFTGSFSNGENAGLVKFNGNQFTVFNTSNSGIDANYIKRIRTQNGKIWVLHQHSISKFDGNQWTTYNAANEIFLESDLIDFTVTPDEKIWVIGQNFSYPENETVFLLKLDGNSWTRYFDGVENNNLLHYIGQTSSIEADENNKIWISIQGYPIIVGFDGNSWDYENLNSNFSFFMLKLIKNGFAYYTHGGEAFRYDIANNTESALSENCTTNSCDLTDIEITNDGKIWASHSKECGEGRILQMNECLDFNYLTNVNFPDSGVYNITSDNLGNIWGATSLGLVKISKNTILGNQETDKKSEIKIFPTVVEDFLNVKSNQKITKIKIFDASGKLMSDNLPVISNQVNLSFLKKGNYLLQVISANQNSQVFKIIKK